MFFPTLNYMYVETYKLYFRTNLSQNLFLISILFGKQYQEEFHDGEELGELINCSHEFHVNCIKHG